ncbi:MAG: serine/threonine-protein phosphatase [Gammaproteobacteria bacterium]|nr:serine/threonine-protein phosphatase [Gammaproteobacteria bacterium]
MRCDTGQANRLGNRSSNQDRSAIVEHKDSLLLMVADGMGGHEGGELAAQEMINKMTLVFQNEPMPISNPRVFLEQLVLESHDVISRIGIKRRPPIYPRTTGVVCLIQNGMACWAHVGDSRLYLIRNNEILIRTKDHTYIEELHQNNVISESEMLSHPMRNYVTQCLGGPNEIPKIAVSEETPIKFDDILLLCSDGLWNATDMNELIKLLDGDTLEKAVHLMAETAEKESYPKSDNISVLALRLLPDAEIDAFGPDSVFHALAEDAPEKSKKPKKFKDKLNNAIDDIEQAMKEYASEIREEKDKKNKP